MSPVKNPPRFAAGMAFASAHRFSQGDSESRVKLHILPEIHTANTAHFACHFARPPVIFETDSCFVATRNRTTPIFSTSLLIFCPALQLSDLHAWARSSSRKRKYCNHD
jgi:hypothetical protein